MSATTEADTVTAEAQTPLSEGQVYTDSRESETPEPAETYTIIFADHQTVVLEDSGGHRRFESRDQFDTARGDRWKFAEDAQADNDSPAVTTPEPFISSLAVLRQSYKASEELDPTDTRADTITDAINLISKNTTDPIPLTEIDGIGDRTAKNLREAGVTTELDVHAASDEFLLDLPGVGQKNLTNLRRHIN
ncbi:MULTISPECIES: helix-hairpin-helix domain-containing protein [Haloferacaceae]|uniref:Helix-hairpin-helix domain-containing protein n=2 Tax=Haloferacaceae TaxID=1644056 RepID=A0ABD6DDR1_9EURY|nr:MULTISPECIES: helix-hairpin-helix domain-containing protein [Halorubraceae]